MEVDEIDHPATPQAVNQVADGARQDQGACASGTSRSRPACNQYGHHDYGGNRQADEESLTKGGWHGREEAEGRTRIERIGAIEPSGNQRIGLEHLKVGADVYFAELIEHEHRRGNQCGHRDQAAEGPGRGCGRVRYRRRARLCSGGIRAHGASARTTSRQRGSRSEPLSSSKYFQQRWHLRPEAWRPATT